jgi:hypothetical protein
MNSLKGLIIFFVAAAAWAQETPVSPETSPPPAATPPAPVKATTYPAFDAGLDVEFFAEQNIFRAYLGNPAYFCLFEYTFIAGDGGGDLSFGGFSYSENGGTPSPGPTEPEEETGLDVSYTAGLGGRALGAYRRDFWVLGGAFDFNRSSASLGYKGGAVTVDPFFDTDDGWADVDLVGQRYGITAAGAAEFAPHVAGGSFSFKPERLEGSYDFEFLPPPGEEGTHRVEEVWGRREVKEYNLKGGYAFRPNDGYDVGGALGFRILRSTINWREDTAEELPENVIRQGRSGALKLRGTAVTIDGSGRYYVFDNVRVGGEVAMEFVPGINVDWTGEKWDLSGPFGEWETDAYRLAKCDERHYRFGGGVAFYPDEKTTLAFDYGYARLSLSAEAYNESSSEVDQHDFAAYHTYTRLGAERWLTDNLGAKIGWEQNLFSYPRNVFFGGIAYKFDDDWFINYDYRGGQLTINNLSLFVPYGDVIKPASHRFTVTWYL